LIFPKNTDNSTLYDRIIIEPEVKGEFIFQDSELKIYPYSPLINESYTVSIIRENDLFTHLTKNKQELILSVRKPSLISLAIDEEKNRLQVTNLEKGGSQTLFEATRKIYDFSVRKDGEFIAFSIENDLQGYDIWSISRDGTEEELLISCGEAKCIEPIWSPDGTKLAYSIKGEKSINKDSYIEVIDLRSKDIFQVGKQRENISLPQWSPDGYYLGFYDHLKNEIVINDLEQNLEAVIQTTVEQKPAWSPDSTKFVYLVEERTERYPYVSLFIADLKMTSVNQLMKVPDEKYEYGIPIWTQDGKNLIYSKRNVVKAETRQLFLLNLGSNNEVQITNDQDYEHASYHLNPIGNQLVYQRYALTKLDSRPEIVIKDIIKFEDLSIIGYGSLPQWLP